MTSVPVRLALSLIAFAGFLGWTVGGFVAVHSAAIDWTSAHVARELKGDATWPAQGDAK